MHTGWLSGHFSILIVCNGNIMHKVAGLWSMWLISTYFCGLARANLLSLQGGHWYLKII